MLADISILLGLIDEDEHKERLAVANWVYEEADVIDPRGSGDANEERKINLDTDSLEAYEATVLGNGATELQREDWIHFVAFKTWYFTRSDPDSYPSVPHGHLHSADRAWPKLNPYTGRVFKAKDEEETSMRLDKKQMRELWRNLAFRDFCRSHILWYIEKHPYYHFRVNHLLRLPRW